MISREQRRAGAGALVGRRSELASFDELKARALAGEPQLASLGGEPGIGKTRLLDEVARSAAGDGWLVGRGAAFDGRTPTPFGPLVDALRDIEDEIGVPALQHAAGIWRPYLARFMPELAPTDDAIGAPADRHATLEGWARLVVSIATRRPVLLALDDLQWSDSATLEAVAYLRRRLRRGPLLLAVAHRTSELNRVTRLRSLLDGLIRERLVVRIAPGRLTHAETGELLGSLLGGTPSDRLVEATQSASEGVPFFVEELVRDLVEHGRLALNAEGWTLTSDDAVLVPASLIDLIGLRLSSLEPAQLRVLSAAATIGRSVLLADVVAVSRQRLSQVAATLEAAASRDVVSIRGDTAEFVHDLVRAALLDSLQHDERQRLHGRVAAQLERRRLVGRREERPSAADVAVQHLAAGQEDRAARWFVEAADEAAAAGAFAEGARFYAQAVAAGQQDSMLVAGASLGLGTCAAEVGEYDQALEALRRAGSVAERLGRNGSTEGATRLHAAACERLGSVYLAQEHVPLAAEAFRAAIDLSADPVVRARAQLGMGRLLTTVTGEFAAGTGLLEASQALAGRAGSPEVECEALAALGQAAMHAGDFDRGRRHFEAALALADRLDEPRLRALAGDGLARHAYWTARFEELRIVSSEELEAAGKTADPHLQGWPTFWSGQAALALGDWDAALRCGRVLVELGAELAARRFAGQGHELLGLRAYWTGDLESAHRELGSAVDVFRSIGPGTLVYYLGPYALVQLEDGAADEARMSLDALVALGRRTAPGTSPRIQAANVAALGYLRLGDARAARSLAPELVPAAEQFHWYPVARTLALIALAERRLDDAGRYLRVARDCVVRGGSQLHLAGIELAEAELARRRGNRKAALELERRAGARSASFRANPAALDAGRHAVAGEGRAVDSLSERERQVLRLVAAGLTNRDIALRLGISQKTAINHVTHIYEKLGVENRSAATAVAVREGID